MEFLKFDLQAFADANVNTTNDNTTGNNLSAEMKTYYDRQMLKNAKHKLIHAQFGQKRNIPANEGKTIQFRRMTPFPPATTPLTEGVTPDGRSLNVTAITATVEQYGDYVTTSDMLKMTAIDPIIDETQENQAEQAGLTFDTVAREILNAGDNVQYSDGSKLTRSSLGAEDVMTVKAIKRAKNTLRRMYAGSIDGSNYVAIMHPDVCSDLADDPEWKDVHSYNPKEWYEGEIGRVQGVRVIENPEAKVFRVSPIAGSIRRLSVKTAVSSAGTSIAVNEAISAADAAAFSGPVDIYIGGKANTITAVNEGAAGSATITLGTATTAAVNDVICGQGGTVDGLDVYSTLVIGKDAYGVTELENGGLETIIKQKGSGGTADPLEQRATIGWKGTFTAVILEDAYMVRVETTSTYGE